MLRKTMKSATQTKTMQRVHWNRELTTLKVVLVLMPLVVALAAIGAGVILANYPLAEIPFTPPYVFAAFMLIGGLICACCYPVLQLNKLLATKALNS